MKEYKLLLDDFAESSHATYYSLIFAEHERQINKWGRQVRSIFEFLAYLTEELGELSKAISEAVYRNKDIQEIEKEAIQVATLALKIANMAKQLETKKEAIEQ